MKYNLMIFFENLGMPSNRQLSNTGSKVSSMFAARDPRRTSRNMVKLKIILRWSRVTRTPGILHHSLHTGSRSRRPLRCSRKGSQSRHRPPIMRLGPTPGPVEATLTRYSTRSSWTHQSPTRMCRSRGGRQVDMMMWIWTAAASRDRGWHQGRPLGTMILIWTAGGLNGAVAERKPRGKTDRDQDLEDGWTACRRRILANTKSGRRFWSTGPPMWL